MKKITLTIIIATAGITGAWSQVNFGIKAGVNIAIKCTPGAIYQQPGQLARVSWGVYLHAKWENLEYNRRLFFPWPGPNRL